MKRNGDCEDDVKVILEQDVKGQGKKGQLVEVSDGYARNFLLPRKLAVPATEGNVAVMKRQEKERQRKLEIDRAAAQEIAAKLEEVIVKITSKAGSGKSDDTAAAASANPSGTRAGKLFGSVTTKEISEALLEQHGIALEKNKIIQDEPIKTFGSHAVKCKLGFEITGVINVLVIEG